MISVQDNSLLQLLPYSLRQDPILVAMAEAAEMQLKEAYRDAEAIYNLVNIDNVPDGLLDLLAYEKHVDFYDAALLSKTQKQSVIKSSISQHRKKGTPSAVERALTNIGIENEIIEWFEYGGNPFRFIISLSIEDESNSKKHGNIKQIIKPTKNTRSWIEKFLYRGNVALHMEVNNISLIRVCLSISSNPWSQAGFGSIGEEVRLDGKYLLNGDRFLNGFYNKDGPAHLQRIKLKMKVLHGFGFYEINQLPSLDGEFNLDGEILLHNEPQNVRLTALHEIDMRYKQREVIEVASDHATPTLSSSLGQSGVISLNGQVQLDGSISLNQALYEHSGFFRIKKAGSIVEEVAI